MCAVQAQDLARLPSLIPPKLSDYGVILLCRAALRRQDAGVTNRIECLREVRDAVAKAR